METEHVDETAPGEDPADRPSWWHRDHPVFTPLSGFFTGLVAITLLPGIYAAVLGAMFSNERAEDLFPFVLVLLLVPLGLLAVPRTRRFGAYLLLGMVLTALVVAGVAALVLWVMVETGS
ncbi:hypothetical protein G6553_05975 [Nocardioides sp. IC4_145]|uniref:hypothetical protein n=1 Tax=Nocardioides sp. IC4_145 TaxID=2714037 RepID=UPI00140AA86F|nr:hypothetical protein [Nocardioides sp. IC4_145]NHC22723.1 hypothetical protein [Nocardioides sp. IC4_145]